MGKQQGAPLRRGILQRGQTMDKVYVVMTELNGYENLEPHPMAYATKEDAEAVAEARSIGLKG